MVTIFDYIYIGGYTHNLYTQSIKKIEGHFLWPFCVGSAFALRSHCVHTAFVLSYNWALRASGVRVGTRPRRDIVVAKSKMYVKITPCAREHLEPKKSHLPVLILKFFITTRLFSISPCIYIIYMSYIPTKYEEFWSTLLMTILRSLSVRSAFALCYNKRFSRFQKGRWNIWILKFLRVQIYVS